MISGAIFDCYDGRKQTIGFPHMITEDFRLPFTTTVLGLTFGVRKIDLNDASGLGETCKGG